MTFARDVRKQLSQILLKIVKGLYLHLSWSIFITKLQMCLQMQWQC